MNEELYLQLSATGTEINYFFVCKRKLWYSAKYINCEAEHDNVALGNLLHSSHYMRKKKEFLIDKVKVDWLDLDKKIIHEVKKSDRMEDAHGWQLRYYIWYFKTKGIGDFTGELNYPELKKKNKITLADEDIPELMNILKGVEDVKNAGLPDALPKNTGVCKKCAYYELCFI